MWRFRSSLLAKKKYISFYLTQTLPGTYICIMSSKKQMNILRNWTLLSGGRQGREEGKCLDHKQTGSNYPEHMPRSKHKNHHSKWQRKYSRASGKIHYCEFKTFKAIISSQPLISSRTETSGILVCSLLSRHISSVVWNPSPAIWLSN